MKFLIEKNIIVPVNKITKDIEEKSIKYSWYTHEGDEIDIYDLENWKLAPIVRYLIEWEDWKKNNLLLWGILIWLIVFAILLVVIFTWNSNETVKQEKTNITKVVPIETKKETETKKEININDTNKTNTENELKNEVEMMTKLKNDSELQLLKNNFEIEKRNIKIQNLMTENGNLKEKLINLQNIIAEYKNRTINGPKDEFIYYLGDTTYEKCENTINDEIKANCKELYFNYLKYAKNNSKNWLYTNKNEMKLNSY